MESELNTCIICSVKHGRMIDGPTCQMHSVEEQEAFAVEYKETQRRKRLGSREKYNSEKNQLVINGKNGNDGWAAGLGKRKEVR